MGTSHGDFIKYPRTPHLFGSKGTDDDKHLGESESDEFIADDSLIVEEKIDGTNVTGRAKIVRPEFVEKINQSTHWQHQSIVPNELAAGVDIWS